LCVCEADAWPFGVTTLRSGQILVVAPPHNLDFGVSSIIVELTFYRSAKAPKANAAVLSSWDPFSSFCVCFFLYIKM
jgi:hypothetical protein